jgi:putative sugar O-methyltransferase
MQKYKLLDLMIQDNKVQKELYKPTSFWEACSEEIVNDLKTNGIENFRNLKTPRSFFAPSYAFIKYLDEKESYDILRKDLQSITKDFKMSKKLDNLLEGYSHAFSDYRVLKATNKDFKPFTDKVSESNTGKPLEQFEFDGRRFSRSFLNYTLGLNFLKSYVDTTNIKTVMEIGGGFGTLGEILLGDERNEIFYINLDIPPVAFVSTHYLQNVFTNKKIADYEVLKDREILNIDNLKSEFDAINTCSWQIEKLQGKIDLFVNFISFQEMEPEVVNNYCSHIRRLNPEFVLLRNIKEGKKKKDENTLYGVEKPILADDYDTFLPEYELVAVDSTIFGFITEDNFHSQLRLYKKI